MGWTESPIKKIPEHLEDGRVELFTFDSSTWNYVEKLTSDERLWVTGGNQERAGFFASCDSYAKICSIWRRYEELASYDQIWCMSGLSAWPDQAANF